MVGERAPRRSDAPWAVSVRGAVARPMSLTLPELRALGEEEHEFDIHCVTRWSRLGVRFRGVPLGRVLELAGPTPPARFVWFGARSERGHGTSLPLEAVRVADALIAFMHEGEPLAEIHGGPVRMVVPGRYFYKSVKWLESIELLEADRLGFWEAGSGYHNEADPWREQRYVASGLSRREASTLLESRDLSGRDLLSLSAAHHTMPGLVAVEARLRNADFRGAVLTGARFERANLSNATFVGADLRDASFAGADVEGADFRGADLRGATFAGASLFGATFCPEPGGEGAPAELGGTRFDEGAFEVLSDAQRAFLEAS